METTPDQCCSKESKNDSFNETLLPGLPDDLAQRCLSSLPPPLLFSVCHPWRRLLCFPSFPPFFSLYALLSASQNPATRNLGEDHVAPQNSIEFFSFDPLSSTWTPVPHPPQDPPLRLLGHPFLTLPKTLLFVSSDTRSSTSPKPSSSSPPWPPFFSIPIPSDTTLDSFQPFGHHSCHHDKLFPALSSPLLFHPESKRWFCGPQVSTPRRWCATGSVRGVVYMASGVGSHYKPDVARSMEQWDLSKKSENWGWENKAQLKDGRFSRDAVEAVGYKGKLCMVNVKGNAVKEGIIYNAGLDKWEDMPRGMVSGWNGPAATMDEDVIYAIDEVKGCLSKYDGEKDCWVKMTELEQLKRAEQIAERRARICVVSKNGERIIVVDGFWEVALPPGLEVVAVHVFPRMSGQ